MQRKDGWIAGRLVRNFGVSVAHHWSLYLRIEDVWLQVAKQVGGKNGNLMRLTARRGKRDGMSGTNGTGLAAVSKAQTPNQIVE